MCMCGLKTVQLHRRLKSCTVSFFILLLMFVWICVLELTSMGHILGYKFLEDKNCYSLINCISSHLGLCIYKSLMFSICWKRCRPGIFQGVKLYSMIFLFKFGIHPDWFFLSCPNVRLYIQENESKMLSFYQHVRQSRGDDSLMCICCGSVI